MKKVRSKVNGYYTTATVGSKAFRNWQKLVVHRWFKYKKSHKRALQVIDTFLRTGLGKEDVMSVQTIFVKRNGYWSMPREERAMFSEAVDIAQMIRNGGAK